MTAVSSPVEHDPTQEHIPSPSADQMAVDLMDESRLGILNFMHSNRKFNNVKGPYNPVLTEKEILRFLTIQFRLQHGELPRSLAPIHKDYVRNFRRMYGFDIESQVDILNHRGPEGRQWNEDDLVLGTRLQDMNILASSEMPNGYFYLIHQVNVVGSPSVLRHYVVGGEQEVQEFKLTEEDAGVLRDAVRTILARAEDNYQDVWRGELEWQNAEPILRRILNFTLMPHPAKPKGLD